jgi:hypothetical protein
VRAQGRVRRTRVAEHEPTSAAIGPLLFSYDERASPAIGAASASEEKTDENRGES